MKKYYPFIIVTICSLAISFMYCPPWDLFFDDKEIFKYTGFLIQKGGIPYVDFFDHKPPLIFFFNYLGALVGNWGFWMMDAALVLFCSIQFLRLNLQYKIYFPVILPILFNLILRNSTISFGMGMTREYTTLCLLLVFCIILGNAKFKYFYLGILAALIFFMQQDQVAILIPFIIYALFENENTNKKLLNKTLQMIGGGLTIFIPIILYFSLHNAFDAFWQDAFLFNFKWYTSPDTKPGFLTEVVALKVKLYELKFEIFFAGSILLGLLSLYIGSKNKWLLIAALIAIPLSFISEFLSGKIALKDATCNYYLLPLAATIPITLFIVFAFTKNEIFNAKVHQFVYGCLFLLNPFLSIVEHRANFYRYPQDYISTSAEIKYLDKTPPVDYQLYVFNNSSFIYAYNRYEIKAPSKWLYHYFWNWYENWDNDHAILQSIIDDLKKHQTKYIISFCEENNFKDKTNYLVWKNFLDSSYRQIYPLKLWQLKQ